MKRNMKKWLNETISSSRKKALPILSFPCIKLLNVSVKELINSSDLQAQGMKAVALIPQAKKIQNEWLEQITSIFSESEKENFYLLLEKAADSANKI